MSAAVMMEVVVMMKILTAIIPAAVMMEVLTLMTTGIMTGFMPPAAVMNEG